MRNKFRLIVLIAGIAAVMMPGVNWVQAQGRNPPATGQAEPRETPKEGKAQPRQAPKEKGQAQPRKTPKEGEAQRHEPSGARAQWRQPAKRGMVVFVGGYFYDPFFGPYPWWPRGAYPVPYYPVFDNRAELRVLVTPREAAVYVDGFYAGIVDDFDGFFQRLPLPPGGHEIGLYLEGYRTVRQRLYLEPGSTFKLNFTMARLTAGEISEPPTVAPALPPPPAGTFAAPRTPPRLPLSPSSTEVVPSAQTGTLVLRVQPARAEVFIDGECWTSSDDERLVIQLAAGPHRIEVSEGGYQSYTAEIQIREGETTPVDVSLVRR